MEKYYLDMSLPYDQKLVRDIKNMWHYKTLLQWVQDINIDVKKTAYFKHMSKVLKAKGNVWGFIKTVDDIIQLIENFKQIYLDYDEKIHQDKFDYNVVDGVNWAYGDFPTNITKDGNFKLLDGHHRFAIRLIKELPLYINIYEVADEWLALQKEFDAMYGKNSLYQPIPHKDFKNHSSSYDVALTASVQEFIRSENITSVVDVGSCHAYTLFGVYSQLKRAIVIEYDKIRSKLLDGLMLAYGDGFENFNGDVLDFVKSFDKRKLGHGKSCVIATAVFHHMAKQLSKDDFDFCLAKLGEMSDYLIYTLPHPSESQFSWMSNYPDMDAYILEKTNKQVLHKSVLNKRTIFILNSKVAT
jgi:hypothetical protein